MAFQFTFSNIKAQYQKAIENGYEIITCERFCQIKKDGLPPKLLVNRVDIDFSVKKAARLVEYNPFSFENYRIIRHLIESGHELGYHSEVIDESIIWSEDAEACLRRDIAVINRIFNVNVKGVASHGGLTGLNNLDFWKNRKASDFGLLYEAYDTTVEFNLFNESFYISDSEWTRWKCYDKGKRVENDHRSLEEHIDDGHSLVHVLIHPDTYFDRHFYE